MVSVESPSFHAGSLVTVRPVKYGVSSLTDFVSERLHCQLELCTCWHDGSETVVLTTPRATLWKLHCIHGVKRSPLRFTIAAALFSVAVVRKSSPDLHTTDQDNQEVDPFPGVVSAACGRVSKLCGDSSTCSSILGVDLLTCVCLVCGTLVLDNIVDGFQPYLVSLATRTQLDLSSTSSTTVGELSPAGSPLEPVALSCA